MSVFRSFRYVKHDKIPFRCHLHKCWVNSQNHFIKIVRPSTYVAKVLSDGRFLSCVLQRRPASEQVFVEELNEDLRSSILENRTSIVFTSLKLMESCFAAFVDRQTILMKWSLCTSLEDFTKMTCCKYRGGNWKALSLLNRCYCQSIFRNSVRTNLC